MRFPPSAVLLGLLVSVPVLAGSRPCGDDVDGRTVPCACGDVLVGSRTLTAADPVTQHPCDGPGLLIRVPDGAPPPVLSLGGRAITGTGIGPGIQVIAGGGLTLRGPGTVRGFDVGILAARGGVTSIADLLVTDNHADGLRVAGAGYAVTGCEADRNGRDGFVLQGIGYHVEGNRARSNGRRGFALAGRDATIGGGLANEATDNGGDGLLVRGRGHDVQGPVATGNGGSGIRARVARARIAGAVATANRAGGVRAAAHDTTVERNQGRDNQTGDVTVHGARVRDGGGNRGQRCRVGGSCR